MRSRPDIHPTCQLSTETTYQTINLHQVISRNLEGMADSTGVNMMNIFKAPSDATPSFGNGSDASLTDEIKGSGVGGGNPAGPLLVGGGGNPATHQGGASSKVVAVARAVSPSSSQREGQAQTREMLAIDSSPTKTDTSFEQIGSGEHG